MQLLGKSDPSTDDVETIAQRWRFYIESYVLVCVPLASFSNDSHTGRHILLKESDVKSRTPFYGGEPKRHRFALGMKADYPIEMSLMPH